MADAKMPVFGAMAPARPKTAWPPSATFLHWEMTSSIVDVESSLKPDFPAALGLKMTPVGARYGGTATSLSLKYRRLLELDGTTLASTLPVRSRSLPA